jgi:hypothetical protein
MSAARLGGRAVDRRGDGGSGCGPRLLLPPPSGAAGLGTMACWTSNTGVLSSNCGGGRWCGVTSATRSAFARRSRISRADGRQDRLKARSRPTAAGESLPASCSGARAGRSKACEAGRDRPPPQVLRPAGMAPVASPRRWPISRDRSSTAPGSRARASTSASRSSSRPRTGWSASNRLGHYVEEL